MATKKKVGQSEYKSSDWNPSRPNVVWVNAKYRNTGNCIIAVRKWDGKQMIPFRAGRNLAVVHPLTVIRLEGEKDELRLNTKRVYQYLKEKSESAEIYTEHFTFGKCPNDAYKVNINDLVSFANIAEYPLENAKVGEIA